MKEYKEVPEMVPLELSEDNTTWAVSNLSGTAGALGVEVNKLRNWLLCFGYASEEFRVVVANLDDWMATPPPSFVHLP